MSVNLEYTKKWISVSVTGFQNDIRDMILYRTILEGEEAEDKYGYSSVRMRDNIARARVQGVNTALNLNLKYGFVIGGGYTFLDAKDFETGKPIDKSIRNIYTVNTNWSHQWNNYNLNLSINGRISDERYSTTYGYAPKYQLWNIATTHSFKFDGLILEPSFGIENVFDYTDDRPYNSNYATLSPGRAFFVSLTVKFN